MFKQLAQDPYSIATITNLWGTQSGDIRFYKMLLDFTLPLLKGMFLNIPKAFFQYVVIIFFRSNLNDNVIEDDRSTYKIKTYSMELDSHFYTKIL